MSARTGGRQPHVKPQMRLTAAPNEIMTRAPLLQAIEQMRDGFEAERGPKPTRWYWDGCPDLKPVLKNMLDLRGHTQGRLTVVGLLAKPGGAWVVRCACGMYEVRKAKALRNPRNAHDSCTRCNYVWHLQRQAYFDRTGKWPNDGEPAPVSRAA